MDEAIGQLLSLDGQVALVTGAATGLGEAIAGVLAAAGAEVVIGDIDEPGGQRVAEELRDRGHRAHALRLDVTDEGSAREAVEQAVALGGRLDVLVNNAGSYHDAGSIIDQTYESWKRAVAVNLEGVFLCSKPAAEHMVARGDGGAIVSISSVDGILPCLGTGYDSAKAARDPLHPQPGRRPGAARGPGERCGTRQLPGGDAAAGCAPASSRRCGRSRRWRPV